MMNWWEMDCVWAQMFTCPFSCQVLPQFCNLVSIRGEEARFWHRMWQSTSYTELPVSYLMDVWSRIFEGTPLTVLPCADVCCSCIFFRFHLPLWLSPQITESTLTSKEMGSCILNLKNVNFQSFERNFKNSSK
jgi:hypothetical protein